MHNHPTPSPHTPPANLQRCYQYSIVLIRSALCILAVSYCLGAQATILTFDLRGSAASSIFDGQRQVEFGVGAVLATFTSLPGAAWEGVFNQTATRFGINTLGSYDDSPSLIDAANGQSEYLTITFSEPVFLEQLVLSSFSPGEQALLAVSGGPLLVLDALAAALDIYAFTDYPVKPGASLLLLHALGNGFSLDSVSVRPLTVREPSSLLLLLLALLVLVGTARLQPGATVDTI